MPLLTTAFPYLPSKIPMAETATSAAAPTSDEDQLLKNFLAEVSEVERDNEVNRLFIMTY